MIYLLLAVVSNCAEAIVVRFSEINLHNRYAVTMINYVITVVMSYFFIGSIPAFSLASNYHFPMTLGIFNGIIFITWLLIFQISVRHNGAPM